MQKEPLQKNIKKYGQDWIGIVIDAIIKKFPENYLSRQDKINLRTTLEESSATEFLKKHIVFGEYGKFGQAESFITSKNGNNIIRVIIRKDYRFIIDFAENNKFFKILSFNLLTGSWSKNDTNENFLKDYES